MSGTPRELPVPRPVIEDPDAIELVRIWAAQGQQHDSLATGVWADPANWGVLLVDLARHVANAYSQTTAITQDDAVRRLREGFDAEWTFATDDPTGTVDPEGE